MVDHDHFCSFCTCSHFADIALAKKFTFGPSALIAISGNFTANIGGELVAECFKIAVKACRRVVKSIEQACEIAVFDIELYAYAFTLNATETDIVIDALDQCSLEGFNVFLDKRNIFVEE